MGAIDLDGVGKVFGDTEVLCDIRLDVMPGEFCVLVGPSGCGKSTLLRLIAGLEEVSAGRIRIAGRDVTGLEPHERGLSMVFQSYALYPHMSVRENIAFALETAREPKAEVTRKVAEAARMLQIEPLLDRRPADLSGGQRQRVAIGRAVVRNPAAFLFDEPLSNLDAGLRAGMRIELAALHRKLGTTMIYVTHDQVEAMTLADRIVVLNAGRIEQVGPPADLYERPATEFVATFLGAPAMNLVAGAAAAAEGAETLGLRPEHIGPDADGPWQGTVAHVEYLGVDTIALADVPDVGRLALRLPGRARLSPGEPLRLGYDARKIHRFRGGRRVD